MMFFLYTYDVVARYLFEVEFPHSAKVPNDETKTQIDKRNGRQPAIFLISLRAKKKQVTFAQEGTGRVSRCMLS